METRFKIGQTVRSLVDAQGLVKGNLYEVIDRTIRHTPFGGFTTYLLGKPGTHTPLYSVGNGHLVLTEVA